MATSVHQQYGAVIADELVSGGVGVAAVAPSAAMTAGDSSSPRDAYRALARRLVPHWLRLVDHHEAVAADASIHRSGSADLLRVWHRHLAALSVALVCEFDPSYRRCEDSRCRVASTLIRWQLSLTGDGQPRTRRQRSDPLHIAIGGAVIRLLSDTSGFQSEALLGDVERHLAWLAKRRPPSAGWLEAVAIGALADGATLVREPHYLELARKRLGEFLGRQHAEGWFANRAFGFAARDGGLTIPPCVEIGHVPRVVDVLARIYQQQQWDEVLNPLRRALGLLGWFERRDGAVVLGIGYDRTSAMPLGVEVLAPHLPEATPRVESVRRCCRAWSHCRGDVPSVGIEDGVSIAAAAAEVLGDAPRDATLAAPATGIRRRLFCQAGIIVHVTDAYRAWVSVRGGGAFTLSFRGDDAPIHDAGVTTHHAEWSYAADPASLRTRYGVTATSVSIGGALEPVTDGMGVLRRFLRWCTPHLWRSDSRSHGSSRRRSQRWRRIVTRSGEDRFRREITFGLDSVRVRDVVVCHQPCDALACQIAEPPRDGVVRLDPPRNHPHGPILVDGGRKVEITRVYHDGRLVQQIPAST